MRRLYAYAANKYALCYDFWILVPERNMLLYFNLYPWNATARRVTFFLFNILTTCSNFPASFNFQYKKFHPAQLSIFAVSIMYIKFVIREMQ